MARKKPAKKAKKKSAARPAARKPAKKTSKKAPRKAAKKAAKKAPRKAPKKAAKKAAPARRSAGITAAASKKAAKTIKQVKRTAAVIKAVGTKKAVAASKGRFLTAVKKLATAAVAAGVSAALAPASRKGSTSATAAADKPAKKPNLDRPRKTVADVHGIPSSLDMDRSASSAKSGRAEMQDKLSKSNSGSAAITAGDVDADWLSAETVGDEAPGGDNPTPDQDRVDDIGRALGVEYADDEELQGGAEIAERDLNRWELDPASKDDFDDEES